MQFIRVFPAHCIVISWTWKRVLSRRQRALCAKVKWECRKANMAYEYFLYLSFFFVYCSFCSGSARVQWKILGIGSDHNYIYFLIAIGQFGCNWSAGRVKVANWHEDAAKSGSPSSARNGDCSIFLVTINFRDALIRWYGDIIPQLVKHLIESQQKALIIIITLRLLLAV